MWKKILNWLGRRSSAALPRPALPPKLAVQLTDPEWPDKLKRLQDRLANTPDEDPTMVGLIGLIDAFIRSELEPTVSSGLDDAEVHRLRGRLGMLIDFKAELLKLWRDVKTQAKNQDA